MWRHLITQSHISDSSWKLLVSDLIKKSVMKSIMTRDEPLAQKGAVDTSANGLIFIHKLVK